MDLSKLKTELTGDPLARGYSSKTDAEIADDLNSSYRTSKKVSMSGSEVFNSIDKGEFNALPAGDKQLVWDILHLGEINPFGIEATLFVDTFGSGSVTITALLLARKRNISRATELGLGWIKEGYVTKARV